MGLKFEDMSEDQRREWLEQVKREQLEGVAKYSREHPMTVQFPHARKVGRIAVTAPKQEFIEQVDKVLVDLGGLDARLLLRRYEAKHERFGTTPFDANGTTLRMYPGGVTIWSGFPGAGKTSLLRQFICHTLKRGSGVFYATLEEEPEDALVRLCATAAGKPMPSSDDLAWFLDAYAQRFRLWSVIGIAQHVKLLALVRELALEGIEHAVIDSLMCLDVRNDDWEGQRRFATLISATARSCGVHIHLVAHPRKLISSGQELDLNDVAGARELGGIADNVLFVRRSANTAHMGPEALATPMSIGIKKQRHFNGAHADITGWYRRDFRQFTPDQFAASPISYLPEEAIRDLGRLDEAAGSGRA
jgi:hypothetical protein